MFQMGSSSIPSASASPSLSSSQIKSIAMGFSAGFGDPNPGLIEHVESSRSEAVLASSGDSVSDNREVFLIVAKGNFVDDNAPRPPGAPAPSGSVLTLTVDAQSGELTDFGIQQSVPDLASLGPVTVDH